ncbi:MAG: diguanylate cyclase, partial [Planctomycetes bacterium]|nr:diguanylate cyclase [Planctomycetota bacterium]
RTVNDDFANPLRRLPGVLALPALAAAAAARLATGSEANLAAALRLDPLALLRALRTAATPALADAAPATGLPTAQSLVRELGVEAVRRLFAARAAGPVDDLRVRAVWLRSLGLAHAARACALRSATFDPEAAYLLGLLANLPDWLATLTSAATAADLGQCLAAWNLPAAVRNALAGDDPAWNGVLAAARALDIDDGSRQERADAVHGQLAAFDLHDGARATAHPARRATDGGAPTTAVQSLLRCSRFDRYRNVIGGLMAAAREHGDYDRVLHAKWHPTTGVLTLQAKLDGSPRRMLARATPASAAEAAALRHAIARNEPTLLRLSADAVPGIAAALAVDELLAVPVQHALATPSFLLLDRSLRLLPIDLARDGAIAATLGHVGTLLHENLLLRRRFQRAQRLSLTDPLTRLFNRRMGMMTLEQEVARMSRAPRPLSLLMCDLDHFKKLNDALGHAAGDRALRAAADVLQNTVRKGDTVCRYGGEEFLVVLPDTHPDDATVLATRLFTAMQARGEELQLPLTVSVGLTSFRPGDTAERMLLRADHALFASKDMGRNRFSADIEAGDDAQSR